MSHTDIPSFAFKNDYCIFITKKAAPHFAEKINATSWRNQAVEVWESTDKQDDLAMIVIPKVIEFWKAEECLFEFKSEDKNKDVIDSDFWGQHDVGYKSKTWNLVNSYMEEEKIKQLEDRVLELERQIDQIYRILDAREQARCRGKMVD